MKIQTLIPRLLLLFLAMEGPSLSGQTIRTESYQGRDVAAGEIIVRFRTATVGQIQAENDRDVDLDLTEAVGRTGAVRIRSRSRNTDELLRRYLRRSDVLYAQPNYVYHAHFVPNDPSFSNQYALSNTGQAIQGQSGTPGADIKALQAWDITQGSRSIVVGVIDEGIPYDHADLAANIWTAPSAFTVTISGKSITCPAGTHGFNARNRTCDPFDGSGAHGSHVSGIIGASGNNGFGISGVSPLVSLMPLQFLSTSGTGTDADAIAAIDFAIQVRTIFGASANVRILNNSWGGSSFSQALLDEINLANANNMLFVVAAGNDTANLDTSPDYPASFNASNIVTVAATDNRDALASFSNFGAGKVHLAAPGVNIYSTTISTLYEYRTGTSMSAPMVSGAAALILSACSLDTASLKSVLLSSVDKVPSLNGKVATGGRLNVYQALLSCMSTPPVNFTLKASPNIQAVPSGGASNLDVVVNSLGGFNSPVDLALTDVPLGITASFASMSIPGGSGQTNLNVSAASSLAAGNYVFNVVATSGSITHSVGVSIVVGAPIVLGVGLSGALTSQSQTSLYNKNFADHYVLQLSSTTSVTIDAFTNLVFTPVLRLLSPNGTIVASSAFAQTTLTTTLSAGSYVVEMTSQTLNAIGNYNLGVNAPTLWAFNPNFMFANSPTVCPSMIGTRLTSLIGGESGSNLVVTKGGSGCSTGLQIGAVPGSPPQVSFIKAITTQGISNAVPFSVLPSPQTIGIGQTVTGTLSSNDAQSPNFPGRFENFYVFSVPNSGRMIVTLNSSQFDTYLLGFDSSRIQEVFNDNSDNNTTNSKFDRTFTSGTHYLQVTSAQAGATGSYSLTVQAYPAVFSASGNSVKQGESGTLTITGNYFDPSMTIDAGSDIHFGPVQFIDSHNATAPFTVDPNATTGTRNIFVTANGLVSDPKPFFSVTLGPAQLTNLSPSRGSPGTQFTVTLAGNRLISPLTVSSPAGITVSNVQIINSNTASALFTIATNAAPGDRSITVTNSGGSSAGVTFTVNPLSLSVFKIGSGTGRVTSEPSGIDCGNTCSTPFTPNDVFVLKAIPSDGSIFSGWSGDADCLDGSVTMTTLRNCTARFDTPQSDSTLLRGDYDGDGKADIGVYRPASGEWYLRLSAQGFAAGAGNWYFQWGLPGDIPVPGDYDGDRLTDMAVFRPGTGEWFLRLSSQNYALAAGNWYYQWGIAGDVPIIGDFDGDSRTDISVFRPSSGEWFLRLSSQNYGVASGNWYFQWGIAGDLPLAGDFDGDRKTDIGVYRPSTGEWYLRLSTQGYIFGKGNCYFQWGSPGDLPVPADFDGDGKTDIAVYRQGSAEWLLRLSTRNYAIASGSWYYQWGTPSDLQLKADFDGDLKGDVVVYRPGTGEWFLRLSTQGYAMAAGNWYFQWGLPGDLPLRR